jgi:hypothetical protein
MVEMLTVVGSSPLSCRRRKKRGGGEDLGEEEVGVVQRG